MISLRLPFELEQELTTIAKLESTTKTQIVREAIVQFIANLKEKNTQTPYSLGHDLFGVYDGDENLSSDYKKKVSGERNRTAPKVNKPNSTGRSLNIHFCEYVT